MPDFIYTVAIIIQNILYIHKIKLSLLISPLGIIVCFWGPILTDPIESPSTIISQWEWLLTLHR